MKHTSEQSYPSWIWPAIVVALLIVGAVAARPYLRPSATAVDKIAVVQDAPAEPETIKKTLLTTGKGEEIALPAHVIAKVDEATSGAPTQVPWEKYLLAPLSKAEWISQRVGGNHEGTITIDEWFAIVRDGTLVGGELHFDISTVQVFGDQGHIIAQHLQAEDFFNVQKFPDASFVMTDITNNSVSGILTMKNTSKLITFPAIIQVDGENLLFRAEFAIDRKQWGIHGGGKMISDYIELSFTLRFSQ